MAEVPSASEVHRAALRLRAEFEAQGLLLAHDLSLPSATRTVAGVPISGSWWGHPMGRLIYAAVSKLEMDIARTKLVAGKSTLVYRSLWPALAAVAEPQCDWQTRELSAAEQELWQLVEREGSVRLDQIPAVGGKKSAEVAKQLELRLLVYGYSQHTDAGSHAKVLLRFKSWREQQGITDEQLPALEAARASLTEPVKRWVGERYLDMLPWFPPRERRAKRKRR